MNRVLCILVALLSFPQLAHAADVGVSISVAEPGFYGRIDIGNVPSPVLVFPQPVIIEPVPVGIVRAPVYLHVPPGHAKKWGSYCHQYGACGYPVYFVQDTWYNDVYVPTYHRSHEHGDDHFDRDHGRERGHDDHDRGPRHEGKHGKGGKGHR